MIEKHCAANKVPVAFVHRVVKRESNYNPRAKGGSALGLMQIKHATARGVGYGGDASGLYDPDTNLKYGIAYFAAAYRLAGGDYDQAYRYYNRGFYFAAKKRGIKPELPAETAPTQVASAGPGSAFDFTKMFGLRASPTPAGTTPSPVLAYAAPEPAAATVVASASVEVPLPPRRPAASKLIAVAKREAPASPSSEPTAMPAANLSAAAVPPAQ